VGGSFESHPPTPPVAWDRSRLHATSLAVERSYWRGSYLRSIEQCWPLGFERLESCDVPSVVHLADTASAS